MATYYDDNGEVIASDTFGPDSQGRFVVAGIEVQEDVYRENERGWVEVERLRKLIHEHHTQCCYHCQPVVDLEREAEAYAKDQTA